MANIFDKDTGNTDNHLLNEQFHAFSKSPSSPGSTLGGASNRSGHTVSASDVWAEKIPAFFYPKADSDYAVCKANAKLNDICRWGDEIQIWDGEKFVKFADNYAAIPDGHEFLNEDGKPVVRFHKSRTAYNLNDTNNAYDNSLDASGKGASAKILGWDKTANDGAGGVYAYVESAPQFITQFVAPTDNIVKGVPSKGYGPIVMVGGSPLTEDADSTAGYIANNFAGIIQFNERKTQGTVTVHAFEYCGKTLGTTASDIAELEDKLSKISVTASGGVQDVSTDAKAAGLSVTTEKRTNSEGKEETIPVLAIETGSVAANETKLVTGGAVKTYVDTTALTPETGSIAKAIAAAVEGAKVTINGSSSKNFTIKSSSVAKTDNTEADIVSIVVDPVSTGTNGESVIGIKATVNTATWDGEKFDDEDALLVAGVAQTVINNTIINQITEIVGEVPEGETPTIATAIEKGITDATLATADNAIQTATGDSASKLVTAEQVKEYVTENAQVTVTVGTSKKTSTGFEFAGSTGTDIAVAPTMDANGKVTYAATLSKATVDSSTGAITNGGLAVSASDAKTIVDKAILAAIADGSTIDTRIDEVITTAVADGGTIDNRIDTLISNATATVDTTGAITKAGLVTAADADKIADKAISDSLTATTTSGTIGYAVADAKKAGTDAKTAADGKVADVTVDGTSIVSGNAGSKTAALTTTKGVEITPNAASASTALATEASVAKALASINSVGVSYEVIPDNEKHTDIANPVKGRIYLEKDTDDADAGVYIEWMYTEKGWEQIGSTKTDHSSYASTITVNGSPKTVANSAVDLGAFASTVASGQATSLANQGSVYANIASNGTLTVGVADASTSAKGLTQLASDVASNSATGVTTAAAVKTYADTKVGSVEYCNEYCLKSETMNVIGGVLRIDHQLVSGAAPSGVDSVVNNVSKHGDSSNVGIIETNMIKDGTQMFYCRNLSEFSSDLSNLENGTEMFAGGTMDGTDNVSLKSFANDMPKLTNGNDMFRSCVNLTSFAGDLSSLTNGSGMFWGCANLTSFTSELSSLTNGSGMFSRCKLDAESLEYIVDSLPTATGSPITIGYGSLATAAEAAAAKAAIEAKGWTCTMEYNA